MKKSSNDTPAIEEPQQTDSEKTECSFGKSYYIISDNSGSIISIEESVEDAETVMTKIQMATRLTSYNMKRHTNRIDFRTELNMSPQSTKQEVFAWEIGYIIEQGVPRSIYNQMMSATNIDLARINRVFVEKGCVDIYKKVSIRVFGDTMKKAIDKSDKILSDWLNATKGK